MLAERVESSAAAADTHEEKTKTKKADWMRDETGEQDRGRRVMHINTMGLRADGDEGRGQRVEAE